MPFGILLALFIFHHYLYNFLGDVPNAAINFGDIAVTGENDKENIGVMDLYL